MILNIITYLNLKLFIRETLFIHFIVNYLKNFINCFMINYFLIKKIFNFHSHNLTILDFYELYFI